MDIQQLQNLLAEKKASLGAFQSGGLERSRINAQQKALQLARALERPRDAILKLCIKIAHDMEIFLVLAKATSPVALADLTLVKPADPLLVERILRLLAANGFVEESAPCEYLPTRLSKEMTERASIGVLESLFLEFLPTFQKAPEYLKAINYRNPDDSMLAALQLILEDLPAVIEEVQGAQDLKAAVIDTVSYDFFKQVQPVQGARAYYFKNVLHDWSDEKATIIFNNLKPAMKPGFSKIIAEEYILPDQNARSLPCVTNMAVMVLFGSGANPKTLERTHDFCRLASCQVLGACRRWAGNY